MIPKAMGIYLRKQLPERTWQRRLVRESGLCFMEFGPMDVDRLSRLGITVDRLGPKLVACVWDEAADLEVGGYLVVDNLAMGRPSMGGIRMLPTLTPSEIYNLARGMTMKNAAANLPYGGGKAGIVADPDLPGEQHAEIVRRFARLLFRYRDIYLPGPDVGTNDADMKLVAIENGLDNALSKPVEMGGNRIDQLGAAGGGIVIAIQALLEEIPRLEGLPQFANCRSVPEDELTVLLQGFGAVGAHAACILQEKIPGAKVIGISDACGYLYSQSGLPVKELFDLWESHGLVSLPYYQEVIAKAQSKQRRPAETPIKYSTSADDLLRENALCFIPAAPIANYLDTDPSSGACMIIEHMGTWSMIVEGANTYSPDPIRKAARARMERAVYRQRGVIIATDYLVNSGGVIFAAQEHLIKTPEPLRIPEEKLGDAAAVDEWLNEHTTELSALAQKRLIAAQKSRDEVIRRNMRELVDLLVSDADMLPCEAAETISIRRITSREQDRTAKDIMERLITIPIDSSIQDAAHLLVEAGSPILAVVLPSGALAGVITDWDITRAAALGLKMEDSIRTIMTRQVITTGPEDSILEIVRKLEYYEISSMPVVEGETVLGMVSTDILARRSLYRLLQTRAED